MLDPAQLRRMVERHFRVYDARDESVRGQVVAHMFCIMFPPREFDARFEAFRAELRAVDRELLAFVRHEGGEDVLFVADRPPASPRRHRLHLTLFLATVVTTVMTGAMYWGGYRRPGDGFAWSVFWSPVDLFWGFVTFALPLMLILGIHELAHYVAARRHGLRATLPFFIPVPPPLMMFGTLGAFISLKDPLPDRRALFDVGASGPIAGFLVALPIILLGSYLTGAVGEPIPDLDRPMIGADLPFTVDDATPGKSALTFPSVQAGILGFTIRAPDDVDKDWSYTAKATIAFADGTVRTDTVTDQLSHGEASRQTLTLPANATSATLVVTWEDGLSRFGDPLLVTGLNRFFDNDGFLAHPTFFAGWVGLLVTGINLLPASQLDGGHVARAVFGERMKYVAWAAVAGLFYLAFQFQSWMLMAVLILFLGVQHPPPLNDRTDLGVTRKVLAGIVLLVFVLTFIPRPIIF
ncbi:MAG: site-2 protease family protein [Candidatus Thermoplasmatota archaeon]